MKFINDPEFDEEYFKKEEINLCEFPESSKYTESIGNRIYGVFSNFSTYFKPNDPMIQPSVQENKIKKMDIYYQKLLSNFKENKNHLVFFLIHLGKLYFQY
jgi:hypothetical protein